MITNVHSDLLAFSYGEGDLDTAPANSKDGQIYKFRNNYLQGNDPTTKDFKRTFFAVMLHGWVSEVSPEASNNNKKAIRWDTGRLAMEILMYKESLIKNRAILLLSCFTGYQFAPTLCKHHLHIPVIAPRSTAAVDSNCRIYVKEEEYSNRNVESQSYYVPNKLDWVFCETNGNIIILPQAELDKQNAINLVKKYL